MPQLSEIVNISKRRESRKERVVQWLEFEPLFNQLRTTTNSSAEEVMRLCGYSGKMYTILKGLNLGALKMRLDGETLSRARPDLYDIRERPSW